MYRCSQLLAAIIEMCDSDSRVICNDRGIADVVITGGYL
jgi:hypothetical protein